MLNLLFNNLSVIAISYFCRWFWHSTSLHCLKETGKHCSLYDSAFEVHVGQLVLCAQCWLLPPLLIIIKISVYFIVFEFLVVGLCLVQYVALYQVKFVYFIWMSNCQSVWNWFECYKTDVDLQQKT
jgi:hypothetical protein